VHSLPESKRYPTESSEYVTVLARHNAIASALFGDGRAVVLVCREYAEPGSALPRTAPTIALEQPPTLRWLRRLDPRPIDALADAHETVAIDVWALTTTWRHGAFDGMIRSVADDVGPSFLLATVDAQRVFAPYDGGADIFLEHAVVRDAWKHRFREWLSARPDGL
jgi:hypothetical protein